MTNIVDLDAFLAEEEDKAPEFHYKGYVWKCPVEVPAVAIFKAKSLFSGKKEQDINEEDFSSFISLTFGKQTWEEMQEAGVGVNSLERIIQATSDYLVSTLPNREESSDSENGESGPKSQANGSEKKSSGRSGSSKQTSGGNTR